MQPALARLSHILLTIDQHLDLTRHLAQPSKHLLVPVDKSQDLILDARIFAKLADKRLHPPQIMPGHTRKEMMNSLKLQTTMNKVEPGGTGDVHGGAELFLGKGLGGAEVGGGHGEVGEGDLDVQGHGDDVGD